MQVPGVAHSSMEYYRWAVRSQVRAEGRRFATAVAREPTVPVLQVHGADDPYLLERTAAASRRWAGPHRRYEVLAGTGHFPHHEQPAAVTRPAAGVPSPLSQWIGRGSRAGHRVAASPTRGLHLGAGQEQRVGEVGPAQVGPAQVGAQEIGARAGPRRAGPPRSAARRAGRRRAAGRRADQAPARSAPGQVARRAAIAATAAPTPKLRGLAPARSPAAAAGRPRGGARRGRGRAAPPDRRRRGARSRRGRRGRRRAPARPPRATAPPPGTSAARAARAAPAARRTSRLPRASRERHLDDVLPRPEAVVGHAAREAPRAQLVVDPAARVGAAGARRAARRACRRRSRPTR